MRGAAPPVRRSGRPAGGPGRALVLASAMALALAAWPAAAEQGPALEVSVPGHAVTVGDHVTVRLEARGPSGLLWGNPEVDTSGAAASRWAVVQPPKPVAGSEPPAWTVVLAPLQTGHLELPPISVTVRTPSGPPQTVSPTATPGVEVASVLPPGQKVEPAPLADPVGVTGFPWEWVLPIAAVALLAVLLAWAVWRWRRRRRGSEAAEPQLPPLDELRSLVAGLAEGADGAGLPERCDRLAQGVRRFLERSTGAPALEMTSFEIQRLARRSGWPQAVQVTLRDVLALTDRVRFARRPVAEAQLEDVLRRLLTAAEELDRVLHPAESSEGEAA